MHLYDLPLELFRQILHSLVDDVGVAEAWTHRQVSTTFAIRIEEEVLGTQPHSAFIRDNRTEKFFRQATGRFLEYRSVKLYGAAPVLPSLVREVSSLLVSVTGWSSKEAHWVILAAVAEAVAQNCRNIGYFLNCGEDPSAESLLQHSITADGLKQNALCVAIGMQDTDLVNHLISDGASIWHRTRAFGLPIRVAYRTRDMDTVNLVLKYSEMNSTGVANEKRIRIFTQFIEDLYSKLRCQAGQWSKVETVHEQWEHILLKRLMRWQLEVLGSPRQGILEKFLEWAWRLRDISLVEAILDIPISSRTRIFCQKLYFKYPVDDRLPPNILATFLEKRILQVGALYHALRSPEWFANGFGCITVLDHAVDYECLQRARIALEWGASPDGFRRIEGAPWPIRFAIDINNVGMVKLLLQYGADPEGGNYPRDKSTLYLAADRRRKEIRDILINAINEKMIRLGDDYVCPQGHRGYYERELPPGMVRRLNGKPSLFGGL